MKPLTALCLLIILTSCYSSKELYNRGDYYSAVVKSVKYLKLNPGHAKSSRGVLQKAYPMAVQSLEEESQNLLASNAPFKYRNTILVYSQINSMYEIIRTTPAALEVIPEPKNFYKEIGDIREKAAEEIYNAGIQSMMGGTRRDARTAYQYFNEVSAYVPQYKESMEFLCKSEEEATLRIIWDEKNSKSWWSVTPVISAIEKLPFVELRRNGTYDFSGRKYALEMNITPWNYSESFPPVVTSSSEEIVDSVKVGEKKVRNVTVPIMEKIKGTYITHQKKVKSHGKVVVTINDMETGQVIFTKEFDGEGEWTGTWTECKGDRRVFKATHQCVSFEPSPDSSSLRDQVEEQIQKDAIRVLTSLLKDY